MKIGDVEVVTVHEAAKRLQLDRTTIARQIRRGAMKAEKEGGIWLVSSAEIERYRTENLHKPDKKPGRKRTPPATKASDADA